MNMKLASIAYYRYLHISSIVSYEGILRIVISHHKFFLGEVPSAVPACSASNQAMYKYESIMERTYEVFFTSIVN